MSDFKMDQFETSGATGIDALLAGEPQIVSPVGQAKVASTQRRVRVSSLQQLQGFVRVASDTLINKATQDLWALRKEGENFFIERLFQDDGQPLKG
jgi:hypothetical protein